MLTIKNIKMEKSAFKVYSSFAEAEADERAYWHSCTPEERLRHVEFLRRLNYGHRTTERLQRVLEVAGRKIS